LRTIINGYQESCTALIEQFGGYVAKYMGDGILAYFGYPQAHEDDPERVVRAGLAILEARAGHETVPGLAEHVRIGVATGLVVAGDLVGEGEAKERPVLGVTPNLAARLQGVAKLDQMVISDQTQTLAGGFFDYEDLGCMI
jgi:class 3 adenylate cyclase